MVSDRDDPSPGPDPQLAPPAVRARAAEGRRARGVRTRFIGATAVVGVVGVVAVLVAVRSGSVAGSAGRPVPAADRAAPLQDGNRVVASGVVVSVPGRPVRLCSPVAVAAIGSTGAGPPPAYCDYGVDVTGVDLGALQDRREVGGAVDGSAELHGVLRARVLVVDRQGPPTYPAQSPPAISPPCAQPVGGWARDGDPDSQPASDYQVAHPGAVVTLALSRPTPGAALVLVLTAGDPEPVRAALSATYRPDQLCVAMSRFSRSEIDSAQRDPTLDITAATGVDQHGESVGADGQPVVVVHATLLTPELAAAVARHPAGLHVIDAWLQREQP